MDDKNSCSLVCSSVYGIDFDIKYNANKSNIMIVRSKEGLLK